ncbi:hypothetical protein [Coraliomargarita parva]|uniref:hypothetical protein n=1 Tax=Coraliomargarita parva TaxID=3014050 RepID=UPI0022B5DB49|nr:hypothetical protein [Coraliomargarita parva]
MKRYLPALGGLLLALYSTILLLTEYKFGQDTVRIFFGDLPGAGRFHYFNTSLCYLLFCGTGLLFLVAASFQPDDAGPRQGTFLFSQVIIFGYLGLDDRYVLHEQIGTAIGIDDVFVLLVLGGMELTLLLTAGRTFLRSKMTLACLGLAGGFFALMAFCDGALPLDMPMRLSMEDLSKTWSAFFLFLYGWTVLKQVLKPEDRQLKAHSTKPTGA